MLFNPEDGKTREEIIEIALRRCPDLRTELEEMAKSSGRSLLELAEEAMSISADMMKDPARRAARDAKRAWRAAPFGLDPLLQRKDGPHG